MSEPVTGRACAASGHPLAAEAGTDALAAGGSAVDAALACAFTQWVVNAPLCGPGGDLLLLHARHDEVTVYGGWSRVPLGLDPAAELTSSGPRAAVVPGALRGAEAAWASASKLPWPRLFQPAIAAAEGHRVTPWMARAFREVERRGHGEATASIFGTDVPPAEGDRVRSERLGATLSVLACQGADALYRGELAEQIDAAARADGGWLRADDLAGLTPAVEPAVRVDLGDMVVDVPGWPSQAVVATDLLAAAGAGLDPSSAAFAERAAPLTERRLVERCVSGLAGTAVSVAADREGEARRWS